MIFAIKGYGYNDISFNHLTVEDGLSQSNVTSVFQDQDGFMWFGTYNGLNKYDGYNFTNYYKSEDTNSLSGNWIRTINEDNRGNLWLGTLTYGVTRYDKTSGTFHRYLSDSLDPNGLLTNDINHILIDSSNNIWFCTYVGLSVYNYKTDNFKTYLINEDQYDNWKDNTIYYAADNNDGNLYLTTEKNDLVIFNKSTKEFSFFNYKKGITNSDENYSKKIVFDKNGDIWIGAIRHGLYKINTKTWNVEYFSVEKNQLINNNIRSLFVDRLNNIWIGTDGSGLNIYNQKTGKFSYYEKILDDPHSLKTKNGIYSIYQSNDGIIWLGQFNGGVNYYDPNNKKFKNYENNPYQNNSLSNNFVLSTFVDSKERIWVGTDGGGLNLFDLENGTFERFTSPGKKCNLSSLVITSINEDNSGNIYLGTWNEGMIKLNCDKNTITRFEHDPNDSTSLIHNDVWAIEKDKNGNLWLGTIREGLVFFNPTKNIFINYGVNSSNKIRTNCSDVRTLFVDSENKLWIGCLKNGVNILDIDSQKMEYLTYYPNDSTTISNNEIRAFYEDSQGNIWIGTETGGINIYDKKTKKIHRLKPENTPLSNAIYGIVEDKRKNIWVCTSKGISRIDSKKEKVIFFDKSDGLNSNEYKYGTTSKLTDGTIIMGGIRGLTVFKPDDIKMNMNIPDVKIVNFLLFNEPIDTKTDDAPFHGNISSVKEINLKHYHSVFTIEYTALNYTSSEKNQYAYKLVGFDKPEKGWTHVGNKRSVTYTNLDPGKYTFKVIASNNDGVWNKTGVSLKIYVHPPFWKTLAFRIFVLICLILILYLLFKIRLKSIKNQKQKLEFEVDKRTKDLKNLNKLLIEKQDEIETQNEKLASQADILIDTNNLLKKRQEELAVSNDRYRLLNSTKDKFFSIISHDLRNPFNVILGYTNLLKKNYVDLKEEDKIEMINALNEASINVYKLLDNLLQWSKSQIDALEFKAEPLNITGIIDENVLLLKSMAEKKNNILVNEISENIEAIGDFNMINTICRNLISNAIKFTDDGKICISSLKSKDSVTIAVEDNGIGILEESLSNLFKIDKNISTQGTKGELGSGLGLILCKEFAKKNNGDLWVESVWGKGSTFYIKLPTKN